MKPKPPLLLLGLIATAFTVSTVGCGADFDPYNRLTGLRVLAVVADPPTPGPGETAQLSALVYTPELGAAESPAGLTYSWSWCPFAGNANDGYQCQISQAQLGMLGAAGMALPPLDLGSNPTTSLANAVAPAVLTQLCTGVPGAPQVLDCTGGFPVQVKVRIKSATDEIVTVASLRLRFDQTTTPNTRPKVDGLTVELPAADPATPAQVMPLDPATGPTSTAQPMVSLRRGEETVIKAQMQPTVIERYLGRDDELNPAMVDEHLVLTWFVETGDTKYSRTSSVEGTATLERALSNKWKPARTKDYAPQKALLVVVARDNRGGVGWRSGVVALTPETNQ